MTNKTQPVQLVQYEPDHQDHAALEKDIKKTLDATTDEDVGELGISFEDADEAYAFLRNHPRSQEVTEGAAALLADPVALKKLVRKIDFTIVPLIACVYFLQFLDKTTLAYTAVMGLRADTHLVGQQYSYLGMFFYVGFLVTEFPTQYLAQHYSHIATYLGINVVLWGIILACHAACVNFAGLAVVRVLLGVCESCVAPILVVIISMWYKKLEQGKRFSWFYVSNSLTSIVGGLVAYGVSFTSGKFASWRIFYIAIGVFTVIAGVMVIIFLPNSPVRARRFTDVEKVAALMRVKENQSGTQNARFKPEQVREALTDVRIWLVALSVCLTSIPNGGISNFSNILLTTFGYKPQQSLILNTPGGVVGAVFVLLCGYFSDKWNDRSTIMMLCLIPTILGAALMIGLDPNGVPINKPGLLAASYLTGTFGASFMLLLAWNASNIAGHTKRVTCNALTLVAFSVGNILGTQTFQAKDVPGYISGKASIIACLCAQIFVSILLRWANHRANAKKRRFLENVSEDEMQLLKDRMAFSDETDLKNPFFVYTK